MNFFLFLVSYWNQDDDKRNSKKKLKNKQWSKSWDDTYLKIKAFMNL